MKRESLTVIGAALLMVGALPPVYRAQSETVKLDVVVTDKDGKLITDLKQDELQIEDDGKKAEIKGFTAVTPGSPAGNGRVAVVLLDDTMPAQGTEAIQQLSAMVVQGTPPGAKVSVVRVHGTDDPRAFDPKSVEAQILGYKAGGVPYSSRQSPMDFLDQVAKLADGLNEPSARRKAIVCVGQPGLCAMQARTDKASDWKNWTAAINALGRNNVSMYSLVPQQMRPGTSDGTIVDTSGGTVFPSGTFANAAERIWSELGSHYMVEYAPASTAKKEVRAVNVKTTRKDAVIHTRGLR